MKSFDAKRYINTPNWQVSRLGLERITKLMQMLDNPQKKCKFIHVAGTNGKGSVCAYISQILIESGYKIGQFTSPFIYDFCERIRINNEWISEEDLLTATLTVKEQADKFPIDDHPTEFELMTALAFVYFASQQCDIVVCEVGMGGRLDSTNVLSEEETILSVVSPIAKDHTQFLGENTVDIAREKAGIFKNTTPIISAHQTQDIKTLFQQIAKDKKSEIVFVDNEKIQIQKVLFDTNNTIRKFSYKNYENLQTLLLATYQPYNAALAIETANYLQLQYQNISHAAIKNGIANTTWPARFEIVETNPYVIIDGGHNIQGVEVLIDSLKDVFPGKKIIIIMGVLADKDYKTMVKKIAPITKHAYTITPPNPRKLDAEKLAECFNAEGIETQIVPNEKAIDIAKASANADDVICAFGSLYSVCSLRKAK